MIRQSRTKLALLLPLVLVGGTTGPLKRTLQDGSHQTVARVPAMTAPAGFIVEPVAAAPLVERPMMAGFDPQGRLFVAESAGKNIDFKALAADPPNFIRMLQDTDADGVFDKSTIFADRMSFPSGALWHEGALYVVSPPSLWKLEDLNDDGVCDRRTEIVTGFGSIGNGADLHGPFLGPDGWLYFCDGRNGHDVTLGDGTRWKGVAAAVYRCRSDGSGLEVVFGGGMDNPVEAVFTPQGEVLVSCNLVMAQPQRLDGILYGIEGGVYPYAGCISEFKRTGDLLAPVGDLGWVSISGLLRYQGDGLGSGFDSNLFSAQFNRHRVQRHAVARDGAGFRISSEDFLTSGDSDFHPTDIIEDADGSLLLIDTGGWFRIGCPQSQVEKPTVLGGIYRIRQRDAGRIDDPRGLTLNWHDASASELVKRLSDARPAVVKRATDALSDRDAAQADLQELAAGSSGARAISAIWILSRRNTDAGRSCVRGAMVNGDPDARRAAIRAAGLARDQAASGALIKSLSGVDLVESREAAIALGRLKEKTATVALLAQLKRPSDRFHEHAIIYALIQIADRPGVAAGLADPNPAVQRGALIALDQMAGGNLQASEIVALLASNHAIVRQEAMTIAVKHPQWAGALLEHLRNLLVNPKLDEPTRRGLGAITTSFARDVGVQKAIADALGSPMTPAQTKLLLLDAIAAASVDEFPSCWNDAVLSILHEKDESLVRQAVDVIRAHHLTGADRELLSIAHDGSRNGGLRVAALAAAASRVKLDNSSFSFLLGQLDKQRSLLDRLSAAQALACYSPVIPS